MFIFKSLHLQDARYLERVMPSYLYVVSISTEVLRELLYQQLATLITVAGANMSPYLGKVFSLMEVNWSSTRASMVTQIVALVEEVARSLGDEFKPYLSDFIPRLLTVLHSDKSPDRRAALKVLKTLEVFGTILEEYLHLVIPGIVRLFERIDSPAPSRRAAIETLGRLAAVLHVADFASRIIHPLLRLLDDPMVSSFRDATLDTLCIVIEQLGTDFAIFIPTVNKSLARNGISHPPYDELVNRVLKVQPMVTSGAEQAADASAQVLGFQEARRNGDSPASGRERVQGLLRGTSGPGDLKRGAAKGGRTISSLPLNQMALKKAWATSQRSTREDWLEWIRRFSVELLRESPSPALRACLSLGQEFPPIVKSLFNVAFDVAFVELSEQFRLDLVASLSTALDAPSLPQEILLQLLNLAEFMEQGDRPLPLDIDRLGPLAAQSHAYAKALHYREMSVSRAMGRGAPATEVATMVESLISVYNEVQQPEAAVGILAFAQARLDIGLREGWYEKLHRWPDALAAYERGTGDANLLGAMRCHVAMSGWRRVDELASAHMESVSPEVRTEMAPMAAQAAWQLGEYRKLAALTPHLKGRPDAHSALLIAVSKVASGSRATTAIMDAIDTARLRLDARLTALIGEGYDQAYGDVVTSQMLVELAEAVELRDPHSTPERLEVIRHIWDKRLGAVQRDVDTWQSVLSVRALAIPMEEDVDTWLRYASLCRRAGRLTQAADVLKRIADSLGVNPTSAEAAKTAPALRYAFIKQGWASGSRVAALRELESFARVLEEHESPLRASVYLRLGSWNLEVSGGFVDETVPSTNTLRVSATARLRKPASRRLSSGTALLSSPVAGVLGNKESLTKLFDTFERAVALAPDWHRAWSRWALVNYEAVVGFAKQDAKEEAAARVVPAVGAFVRAIELGPANSLQDTLRLLTLWFEYGTSPEVLEAVTASFSVISVDVWLQVVPQVMARIAVADDAVRRSIHDLLELVGRSHPQALVYPLAVQSKSVSVARHSAANAIVERLRAYAAQLLDEAELVSHELIRSAILWLEMWNEGLEEASRLYFADDDVDGMLAILLPLHEALQRGPETLRESAFMQTYGRDLDEAFDWLSRYRETSERAHLNAAWDVYYRLFKAISKQLPATNELHLQYVSPRLQAARSLQLAVPGTYVANEPVVRIARVSDTLTVIKSKQRPRKISIMGSDGVEYFFLLKGHEDLRQDERVMQLFGLVNSLLQADRGTGAKHLSIQRFNVIPLSPTSGLLSWVPAHDTLHQIIREYRKTRNIDFDVERRKLADFGNPERLTLMQRIEAFEAACATTDGQDVARSMWLSSPSSEVWLDRRTTFTHSLAVMSMVGYMLGLGDRHPSNLMVSRRTGKVTHIDFGDCFEVAMQRDKFPEKVPFRLTRMLIAAMEVAGVEGTFRSTCEGVMRVLRESRESLMAVLEAFVHDPLLNWRLLQAASRPSDEATTGATPAPTAGGPADQAAPGAAGGAKPLSLAERRLRREKAAAKRSSVLLKEAPPGASLSGSKPAAPPSRSDKGDGDSVQVVYRTEEVNERSLAVIERIEAKLTGTDFGDEVVDVSSQVDQLIRMATSQEHMAVAYQGWGPFF
jgi:FKBP12-rapamycin complex-associated protein